MLSKCLLKLKLGRTTFAPKRRYNIVLTPGSTNKETTPDANHQVKFENDYFRVTQYPEIDQETIDSIKQMFIEDGVNPEKAQVLDQIPEYIIEAKKWHLGFTDVDQKKHPSAFSLVDSTMNTLFRKCMTAQDIDDKQREMLHKIAQKIHDDPDLYHQFMCTYQLELTQEVFLDKIKSSFNDFFDTRPPKADTLEGDIYYAYMWSSKQNSIDHLRHAIAVLSYLLQTNEKVRNCATLVSKLDTKSPDFKSSYDFFMNLLNNISKDRLSVRFIAWLFFRDNFQNFLNGSILRIFDEYHKFRTKTVNVEITTPSQIDENGAEFYRNLVINSLDFDGNYKFKLKVDPSIIDGYVLNIEGKIFDYSRSARQRRIADAFSIK